MGWDPQFNNNVASTRYKHDSIDIHVSAIIRVIQ